MSITFDPYKTQGFSGSFRTESKGFTQGDAQDDPAMRFQLAAGVLSNDVTQSMWGGLAILELTPMAGSQRGSVIKPATATQCSGFIVSNQAFHGVVTPSSSVPQYPAGGSVHYYRFGSLARIPLPISAAVAALADGATDISTKQFAWDVTQQWVDVVDTSPTVKALPVTLLGVSNSGNLAAKFDATTRAINWADLPLGLFLI